MRSLPSTRRLVISKRRWYGTPGKLVQTIGQVDWKKVTRGQNNLPNEGEYLHGAAPNEVADNDNLKAKLHNKNAAYAQFNKGRSEKRASKIEEAGQFRAMTSRGGAFARGFKPRYEGVLRQAAQVKGPLVLQTRAAITS